jgi:chitinase
VADDSVYEGDETLTLDLTNPVNGQGSPSGTGTITEDDAAPQISVDDPSVGENAGPLTFTISIDQAADVDTSVDYATADGSATDGSDYTGQAGTATITAGNTSTTVDIAVADDSVYEGDETLTLDLTNPVNGQGSPSGTGTITEDDAAPGVSIADATVTEGNGGTTDLTFTVSLTNASSSDVTVDYDTSDGSAGAPGDYHVASGTLTIPAGDTSGEVTVAVKGDTALEPDETLVVTLSRLGGGSSIDDATATGTITNDDKQAATLTVRVVRHGPRIKAKGILEPASAGNAVGVTLAKYKHGKWVKVAASTKTVRKIGDRDHDGAKDAQFGAAFPRPAKGKYRFTVTFGGDANTNGKAKKVTFRL